jgi:hypothetical protein
VAGFALEALEEGRLLSGRLLGFRRQREGRFELGGRALGLADGFEARERGLLLAG